MPIPRSYVGNLWNVLSPDPNLNRNWLNTRGMRGIKRLPNYLMGGIEGTIPNELRDLMFGETLKPMYQPGVEYKPMETLPLAMEALGAGWMGGLPKGAVGTGMTRRVDKIDIYPKKAKDKIKIIEDENVPITLEGYFNDKTNTIHISPKSSNQRKKEVIKHELKHVEQKEIGDLPTSKYVPPKESIKEFMEYFTDPKEVTARASEKGESISEIWNEVFRLREQTMKGEYLGEPFKPPQFKVEKIIPAIDEKVVPDRPIIGPQGSRMMWHMKRITGQLGPNDPKPVLIKSKLMRIFFKDKANGIIAENMLRDAGIEAFNNVPFSVDVTLTDENIKKIFDIFGIKKTLQLPKP
jgi:hypothetical protein